MPKNYEPVKVVKIPLRHSTADYPQIFPRIPRLYLELIENKTKIKQDLINKEYVPSISSNKQQNEPIIQHNYKEEYNKEEYNKDKDKDKYKDNIEKYNIEDSEKKYDDNLSEPSEHSVDDLKKNDTFESRLDKLLSDDSDSQSKSPASTVSAVSIDEKYDVKDDKSSDSDDLSARLKELLNDSSDDGSVYSRNKYKQFSPQKSYNESPQINLNDKYSRPRDNYGQTLPHPSAHGSPPTLKELEQRGGYVPRKELRDINQTSMNEHQEEDAKREILFKFDLLKKSYPASVIPEYTIHSDYRTMNKSYEDTVRRLSLDSSVENYKTYLVYGFMGCEFILGNFLGFDMQGFTQQQIVSMNSYEKLLIELGEKSYVPSGSKWPVELRLLFMIIMNAAFFLVSKMIMKKTGANLIGMVNNMNNVSDMQPNGNSQRKRKMRGPNIDLGDLPETINATNI